MFDMGVFGSLKGCGDREGSSEQDGVVYMLVNPLEQVKNRSLRVTSNSARTIRREPGSGWLH